MKKLYYFLIIALGLGGGGLWYMTKQNNTTSTDVIVLFDKTDSSILVRPDIDILEFYDFKNNPYSGGSFNYSNITDIDFNKSYSEYLKPISNIEFNKISRKKEINLFQEKIKGFIAEANKIKTGKNHSSIYYSISQKLEILSQSKSQKRVLIIYSDMMENSDSISFYDPLVLEQLKSNNDSIIKRIGNQKILPSLKGIDIYIVFEPTNYEQNKEFRIVSEFYKSWFKEKGAKVFIGADLNSQS